MTKTKSNKTKAEYNIYIIFGVVFLLVIVIGFYLTYKSKQSHTPTPTPDIPNIPTPTPIVSTPTPTVFTPTVSSPTPTPVNKALIAKSMRKILDALTVVQNVPTQITSTYGKTVKFYVSGKASLPLQNNLVEVGKINKVTSVLTASGLNEDGSSMENPPYPPETTIFVYDPSTSIVTYYKGSLKLSELPEGTLTIGSVYN